MPVAVSPQPLHHGGSAADTLETEVIHDPRETGQKPAPGPFPQACEPHERGGKTARGLVRGNEWPKNRGKTGVPLFRPFCYILARDFLIRFPISMRWRRGARLLGQVDFRPIRLGVSKEESYAVLRLVPAIAGESSLRGSRVVPDPAADSPRSVNRQSDLDPLTCLPWRSREVNVEPTVFVVDDDVATRRLIVELLKTIFPQVEAFASAAEFLAEADPARPGCLVLDVAMPGMSGLELQKTLSLRQIDLPIVFLTGHGNVQMAVGAIQAGAVDFIEKPFRDHELWDSVRKALEIDTRKRQEKAQEAKRRQRLALLSAGERDVLAGILEGKYNKQIAGELNLSIRTVEDRRAKLMKKLQVSSVVELVQFAMPLTKQAGAKGESIRQVLCPIA